MVNYLSNMVIPIIILSILLYGKKKKVNMYDVFAIGAKESINTALSVFPYLITMLIAISIFRSSGLLEFIISILSPILDFVNIPKEVFPLGIMRPISGSGSTAMLTDILINHHPDSLIGKMASTMMGSTETTFYVVALYLGSIGIKRYKYTVKAALLADTAGFISSIIVCYILFS
ncbi:spore maturation protein [Alkalibaculum sp. M08DMB]|uniref:Spore maturation protein n=1 Tax=Alkalibaculum sporogenes TaxID=2655001 RepID=A0A6A7K737_9FIRM|nr:nucleoside recognition domain-containing protein [Alkalibaculum sporogenes]MPW25288.1 spore maturation protein [Alkalibaculum sporogenes]